METLYRLELRRHGLPADSSDSRRKLNVSTDRLCAWFGSEQMCVNVSRKLGDCGTGEVQARLFHSSRLLNRTGNCRSKCFVRRRSRRGSQCICLGAGVPADNSVKLRWARGASQLSVLAELLAGGEHLRTQFNGGKADQETPQWEYLFKLSHQAKALLRRGLSKSIRARTHYQVWMDHVRYCHMLAWRFCISVCFSSLLATTGRTGSRFDASRGGQEDGRRPFQCRIKKWHSCAGSVTMATAGAAPGSPSHIHAGTFSRIIVMRSERQFLPTSVFCLDR